MQASPLAASGAPGHTATGHSPEKDGGLSPRHASTKPTRRSPITCAKFVGNTAWRSLPRRPSRGVASSPFARQHIYNTDFVAPIEITFDGATAKTDSGAVVGGAAAIAILVMPRHDDTTDGTIARLAVAIPAPASQSIAEAWGARLACEIISQHPRRIPRRFAFRVGGDNQPTVRYCRNTGRLHGAVEVDTLDAALSALAADKRHTEWVVIPRKANEEANTCAGTAARLAAKRACGIDVHEHDTHTLHV